MSLCSERSKSLNTTFAESVPQARLANTIFSPSSLMSCTTVKTSATVDEESARDLKQGSNVRVKPQASIIPNRERDAIEHRRLAAQDLAEEGNPLVLAILTLNDDSALAAALHLEDDVEDFLESCNVMLYSIDNPTLLAPLKSMLAPVL